MPCYPHICENCGYEWEDFYSIKQDPPTECPECKFVGKVKRLISGDQLVKMVLNRKEWKAKVKEDTRKLKQELKTNENLRANFVGEEKYNTIQKETSEVKKNLKNI